MKSQPTSGSPEILGKHLASHWVVLRINFTAAELQRWTDLEIAILKNLMKSRREWVRQQRGERKRRLMVDEEGKRRRKWGEAKEKKKRKQRRKR